LLVGGFALFRAWAAAISNLGERRWIAAAVVPAAVSGWLAASAAGAFSPIWIAVATGATGACVRALLPRLAVNHGWELLAAGLALLTSTPRVGVARIGIAMALVLVVGAGLDRWARSRSVRACLLMTWIGGATCLAAAVFGSSIARNAGIAPKFGFLRIGLAPVCVGERVELPTGSVAWLDRPVRGASSQGALLFHGANPAGSTQPAACVVRRALLDAGYVVLSVDHPGYGESPAPGVSDSVADWNPLPTAHAALRWLGELEEVDSVIAVGHSLGASDVLRLLAESGEISAGVMLGAALGDLESRDEYWHGRFHTDRGLEARMSFEKWLAVRNAYYDNGRLADQLAGDHAPVLFVRFVREHANLVASRDSLFERLPGRKLVADLASFHYFDARIVAGVLLGDTGVMQALADSLRALQIEIWPIDGVESALEVPRFGIFGTALAQGGQYANPYREVEAFATFRSPSGEAFEVPLFWDGGATWRIRFAPREEGTWRWEVSSTDPGLQGRSGAFRCVASSRRGGVRVWSEYPHHFERQDGTPYWLFGDTQWSAFGSDASDGLERGSVEHYIDRRAAQGFNFIHANLLSPGSNEGGPAFESFERGTLNPRFWREVDHRLAYMNARGVTVMLLLAWGTDVYTGDWESFPDDAARLRYARYVAARYGAFDVMFNVSGEWNEFGERDMYSAIARHIADSEPHDRLIGIHGNGSVEEFASEPWMGFGDYAQIYKQLHEHALRPRAHGKPVVNSEYAYFLRDANGDGVVDKYNSATLEQIRHATWDIAMAGGYFVTGWGTTYFGGRRDPGPFNPDDPRNAAWEDQIRHVPELFESTNWWRLEPADHRVTGPGVNYCLVEPGISAIVYVRGSRAPRTVRLEEEGAATAYRASLFDPRSGAHSSLPGITGPTATLVPPDDRDWVFILERTDAKAGR
jgi:pimeloyl-ACP methyl ester carboxylesterase